MRQTSSTQDIVTEESETDAKVMEPPSPRNFSLFKGLLLSFISGVFYSLCAVIVKYVKNIHPGQLAVYRFVAIFAFSFPEVVWSRENPLGPKDMRFLLVLRGLFGATNLFLNFLAFRYLPLGEAAVIIFSVPVFVTIAAKIFLKEPCGMFQTFTVLVTVVGIILITKIPETLSRGSTSYTKENLWGVLAALGSLVFSTSRFIVLRKVKKVHHSVVMFNFGWVAILETVILTAILGDFSLHGCGQQQYFLILLGFFSHIGQTLLTIALQCEQAGPVSTTRAASDIILAFVWQMFVFHDVPDAYSISGAVLVSSSVVLVGMRKWVMSLPRDSSCRKMMKFLTI